MIPLNFLENLDYSQSTHGIWIFTDSHAAKFPFKFLHKSAVLITQTSFITSILTQLRNYNPDECICLYEVKRNEIINNPVIGEITDPLAMLQGVDSCKSVKYSNHDYDANTMPYLNNCSSSITLRASNLEPEWASYFVHLKPYKNNILSRAGLLGQQ